MYITLKLLTLKAIIYFATIICYALIFIATRLFTNQLCTIVFIFFKNQVLQ